MKPKVSICIPAYKQTTYLENCLNSIIIQEYSNYEIVITDDSPDNSVIDLLRKFDFKGKLVYKKNTIPLGSPKNWNEGFIIAQGEYIKILHHDDWFADEYSLGKYVKLLDDNPDVDFGFSACIWVHSKNNTKKPYIPSKKQIDQLRKDPSTIFPENFISTPSTIIFRNENKQYFDEKIKWLVDTEYYFRCLMQNNKFAYCHEPIVMILIEATHQVTSTVRGSRGIEIKEWVYYYSKIREVRPFNWENYLHLKKVFENFNIKNEQDIKDCGVDEIGFDVKSILITNSIIKNYKKFIKEGEIGSLIYSKLLPKNSKREKLINYLLYPFIKTKNYLKNEYLKTDVLLSEEFSTVQIVDVVSPVVRGFEIDHSLYNYGYRIIIECDKIENKVNASGRWQINWLDSNNNFVFATYIPFELNESREKFISPLINNVPLFAKKGILYLTSHDATRINIYSYSFNAYSIENVILNKIFKYKTRTSKNHKFKIEQKVGAKNILFIIPWMSVGGGDMVNLTIAENLAKLNYNIHFFISEKSKNEWEGRFKKITKNIVVLPRLIKNVKSQYEYIDPLVKYINEAKIEAIIVSNSEFGYSCLPVIKNEFSHLKVFDLLHGQGGSKEGGGFPEYSKIFNIYLDRRITINRYLKNYLIKNYQVEADKIEVIHNGIDTTKFSNIKYKKNNEDKFVVTYVGRLSYEKHPEKIIDIAEMFYSKGDKGNACFRIVGDGPMYTELNERIELKGLSKFIKLVGHKENVKKELENTDLLLLCSEMEGLPIVILEAMAMSVPCVASNVGGIPELIDDGKNGYLVDYDQKMVDVFAKKIEILYENTSLRSQFTVEARNKILNQFSVETMINSYEKILNS